MHPSNTTTLGSVFEFTAMAGMLSPNGSDLYTEFIRKNEGGRDVCNVPNLASLGNTTNVCVGSKVYII
jgi:hypothetical protein